MPMTLLVLYDSPRHIYIHAVHPICFMKHTVHLKFTPISFQKKITPIVGEKKTHGESSIKL